MRACGWACGWACGTKGGRKAMLIVMGAVKLGEWGVNICVCVVCACVLYSKSQMRFLRRVVCESGRVKFGRNPQITE